MYPPSGSRRSDVVFLVGYSAEVCLVWDARNKAADECAFAVGIGTSRFLSLAVRWSTSLFAELRLIRHLGC